MKNLQNPVSAEAYKLLRNMIFRKTLTQTVKRAVRVRLEAILAEEETCFNHWKENVRHKLNVTRQKMIEREFQKRIQAMKIVIHALTPFFERVNDVPTFVVRKDRNQ